MSFGSRLVAARAAYGPLCVGIDPHASLLADWGLTDDLGGLARFSAICVDAFAGRVGFVKPQSAFFERFGAAGVAVLERTIQALRHTGTLVILDVKRGDIGSTAAAYATAYLDDDSPMAADAVTVSPFLGFGSLEPFFTEADRNDAGVFVLARTSNPEGAQVQSAIGGSGESVAAEILGELAARNRGATPLGSHGAVVGATLARLDENVAINGPLLVPGFGAQGGTVDDLRRLFGQVWEAVLPSSSRGVLAAGPDPDALAHAVTTLNAQLVGS